MQATRRRQLLTVALLEGAKTHKSAVDKPLGHLIVLSPKCPRKLLDGLSDDQQLVQHSRLGLHVVQEFRLRLTSDERRYETAARAISSRVTSSRRIPLLRSGEKDPGRSQNFPTPQPIGTPEQGPFGNQINPALKKALQFLLHLDVF
jgi:hypothetical protein